MFKFFIYFYASIILRKLIAGSNGIRKTLTICYSFNWNIPRLKTLQEFTGVEERTYCGPNELCEHLPKDSSHFCADARTLVRKRTFARSWKWSHIEAAFQEIWVFTLDLTWLFTISCRAVCLYVALFMAFFPFAVCHCKLITFIL